MERESDKRDQLHKAQLKIAKEIRRICDRHEINYFLDCGSLLGAIRHKGFIPWDDDMDIGMLKKDYDIFLEFASKELGDDFFLDNYLTNPDNALVFSKVRLRNTKYIEEKGNEQAEHNEVFVDVFPYYYISDNEFIRKCDGMIMTVISQAIMSKKGYKVWKGEQAIKRLKFLPTDLLGLFFHEKTLRKWIENLYNKYSDTKRVCIHSGSCYDFWFFPKEILDEYLQTEFEGEIFKIPKEYDLYLSTTYGDYMKLPPKEKRVTHMIKELDLGPYNFQ